VDPAYTTTTTGWPAWTSPVDPAYTTTTTTWADWSYTASSVVAGATGHAVIAPSGDQWAMTYSLYTATSSCKDQGTVAAEIAIIASKGFTSVRVYSTDCSTLEFVGQACRDNGLKLILGIYISSTGVSGASQQVTDIITWAQWDIVELIVVGNEAVFNGYSSASDLAWFISSVKSQAQAAGYTGPVTTTEPLSTWLSVGTTFCSVVDVVGGNLYAFFNAQTTADQAGAFIQSEIAQLEGVCSGLEVYVMESGWPTAGECNGVACPGVSEQGVAITSIQSTTGAKVVFFTYENDLWKEPGQFGVEQYWGCADVFPTKW
jgi:exo-beta-1,3-glucanase (GH17 family)